MSTSREVRKVKQPLVYEVDLTKIQGKGDFPCPNCGVVISPEDETGEVYHILETKVKGQALEELVIQCNKCGSKICVVGFLIPEMDNPRARAQLKDSER